MRDRTQCQSQVQKVQVYEPFTILNTPVILKNYKKNWKILSLTVTRAEHDVHRKSNKT